MPKDRPVSGGRLLRSSVRQAWLNWQAGTALTQDASSPDDVNLEQPGVVYKRQVGWVAQLKSLLAQK